MAPESNPHQNPILPLAPTTPDNHSILMLAGERQTGLYAQADGTLVHAETSNGGMKQTRYTQNHSAHPITAAEFHRQSGVATAAELGQTQKKQTKLASTIGKFLKIGRESNPVQPARESFEVNDSEEEASVPLIETVEIAESAWLTQPERPRIPELEKLLAPVADINEVTLSSPRPNYDYLHEKDRVKRDQMVSHQSSLGYAREQEARRYTEVTKQSREDALQVIDRARASDKVIDAILADYQAGNPDKTSLALVEAVRIDTDLRYQLGDYLYSDKMQRLLDIDKMPSRISSKINKAPEGRGYTQVGEFSSRMYATVLALAMLDGTYHNNETNDRIELSEDGKRGVGQHRSAAKLLLG